MSHPSIDANQLLGRDPINLNLEEILSYTKDKRVLITGAGGSIGSELARQLLRGGSSRLYLFGHGENSIYQLEKELHNLQKAGVGVGAKVVSIIGELQDEHYMKFLLKRLNAQIIFHCAAHKHVPLMESNPIEAVKNNVFGVYNLIEAAKETKVERLALISTDKAVNPYNVYGCSKALGERLVMQAHKQGYPFFVVRFGNVLGSRGSIVPLFQEQIAQGGPLTITHPDIERFFMTIPEAVSLVLLAGRVGSRSGLYLLDMGQPIKIIDLAKNLAQMAGFNVDNGDIALNICGLRLGERLTEELYSEDEEPCATEFDKLLEIKQKQEPAFNGAIIEKLKPICYYNPALPSHFRNRRLLQNYLEEQFSTLEKKDFTDDY